MIIVAVRDNSFFSIRKTFRGHHFQPGLIDQEINYNLMFDLYMVKHSLIQLQWD